MHGTLSKALKQAVRWGLIPRNACEVVSVPKGIGEEVRPLNAEDAKALLKAAEGYRLEALYVLALTTGLRLGEVLALLWTDLDPKRGVLSVNWALTRIDGGWSLDRPKTARSRRTVRLTPGTMAALKKHRRRQKTDGLYRADGLVFCSRTGTLLNPSNVRNRSFRPLLDRAGLAKISFHAATRHTAATLLLGRNVHPKIVREMLGHSTVKLTLDTYSHLLPGMADGAVDAMRDALEGDGPGEELEGTVPRTSPSGPPLLENARLAKLRFRVLLSDGMRRGVRFQRVEAGQSG